MIILKSFLYRLGFCDFLHSAIFVILKILHYRVYKYPSAAFYHWNWEVRNRLETRTCFFISGRDSRQSWVSPLRNSSNDYNNSIVMNVDCLKGMLKTIWLALLNLKYHIPRGWYIFFMIQLKCWQVLPWVI